MQLLKNTKINFLGLKWVSLGLSTIAVAVLLGYMIINGLNLGIDFEGGRLIHLKYQENPDIETVRAHLAEVGFGDALLQQDDAHKEIMIRVKEEGPAVAAEGEAATEQVSDTKTVDIIINALRKDEELKQVEAGKIDLNIKGRAPIVAMLMAADPFKYLETQPNTMTPEAYAEQEYEKIAYQLIKVYRDKEITETKALGIIINMDDAINSLDTVLEEMGKIDQKEILAQTIKDNCFIGTFGILGADMVSATVGSELGEKAIWAIVFSLGGILVYIWFRFNNRFSVAAIIALVHDVIITMGIFTIMGREFNLPIVAAVLTIVGYSLNDTIVIFVRIRETLTKKRQEAKTNYRGLLNESINITLSRTLLTSVTTLIVVLFLFFMGGSVINDFAFTLMVGVIVGTYSSIFVASPVLAIWKMITGNTGVKKSKKERKAGAPV